MEPLTLTIAVIAAALSATAKVLIPLLPKNRRAADKTIEIRTRDGQLITMGKGEPLNAETFAKLLKFAEQPPPEAHQGPATRVTPQP